jgi:hypothetical protein
LIGMADQRPTPDEEVRRLYGEAEARTAQAMERVVNQRAFGELLGMAAENTVALMKLGNDALDLVVRNLRIAGRRDIIRLGRQLARTEDKLEQVLQEIEALQARQAASDGAEGTSRGERQADGRPDGTNAGATHDPGRRAGSGDGS